MNPDVMRALLEAVATGNVTPADALRRLENPYETDLGFAVVDQHRALRQGLPEVVFGEGKEPAHVVAIARALLDRKQNVLVTRLDEAKRAAFVEAFPTARENAVARTVRVEVTPVPVVENFRAAIVCAGTSDLPVFEECSETLAAAGIAHDRITDVGVAGIHRLFARIDTFRAADAVVVIAGMEGALPSVVGGLVACPVIAVPTSVGYGAGAGGYAALLGMLSSCASGLTVCNIDNGFGAAIALHRMARLARKA
jgi:hypothetical protein